jgi:hypothetical protein
MLAAKNDELMELLGGRSRSGLLAKNLVQML